MTREEYAIYLESEHWREFSVSIKKLRNCCEKCGVTNQEATKKWRQALNVHHLTYKNIGHESPKDVIVVCWKCHMTAHGALDWVKFTESKKMPDVKPFPAICANCGVTSGDILWNFDELYQEWLCSDCR